MCLLKQQNGKAQAPTLKCSLNYGNRNDKTIITSTARLEFLDTFAHKQCNSIFCFKFHCKLYVQLLSISEISCQFHNRTGNVIQYQNEIACPFSISMFSPDLDNHLKIEI